MAFRGQIVHINLSTRTIEKHTLSPRLFEDYLGGRGIGVRLLIDSVDPDVDPLSPQNVVIICAGTLTGTFAPGAARLTVTAKSVETGIYCKSSVGGHFAPELKFAGYDALKITGASSKPVYISIQNESIQICDAQHLWGKDVRLTNRILKAELEDAKTNILAIGPAGENLVAYSGIAASVYRQAARGGLGAIFGSKKLKAIAVRGTIPLRVADPKRFQQVALTAREQVRNDQDRFYRYFLFGTNRGVVGANQSGANSVKNFQTTYLPEAYKTGGEYIREKYLIRENGCGSCVLTCGRSYEIEHGPYAGTYSEGPEWEAGSCFGARLFNNDPEIMLKANEISNINGLDLLSATGVIAFAMECYQRGLLTNKQTEGLQIEWGNGPVVLELLEKIIKREGIGELLSKPILEICKEIGQGSEQYAMQIKGLPLSSVELRSTVPYALAFAVNPRGGDHLHTEIMCQFGSTLEHSKIANRITGTSRGTDPLFYEGKAKLVTYHEEVCCASDCLGVCFMHTLSSHRVTPELLAEMFQAATGISMDVQKLRRAGERVINLERMFNVHQGLGRADDTLPSRFFEEIPGGPGKGRKINRKRFDQLLQEFYHLRGWSANGIPTEKRLKMLGLDDLLLHAAK